MMDGMRHIKAFLTVARLKSFTRASAELHVSQPALTVQIQQLEHSFGVKLFDRNNRRVALTSAGRDVLAPLERVLVDAEAVVHRVQNLAGMRRGLVKIAAEPFFGVRLLPIVLSEFSRRFPDIEWRLSDLPGEKISELVKTGEVDFGLDVYIRHYEDASLPPILADRQIRVHPILSDPVCAVVHCNHVLAAKRTVTVKELAKYPIIRVEAQTSGHVEYLLHKEGLSLTSSYIVNCVTTAIGLARANLGIALLPGSAIRPKSHLRCLTLRPKLTCEVAIISRAGHQFSQPAEKLIEILRQEARLGARR
jgi:DNA-binding transcriptional LysR family regulator